MQSSSSTSVSQLLNKAQQIRALFISEIGYDQLKEKTFQVIKKYLKNRWRIKIQIKDIVRFSLSKLCDCCRSKKSVSQNLTQRKINLYRKGELKIKQELDCVNLMTKLRQLDLFLSLYLNKNQKFLLNLQKKFLIQEKDTSDDEKQEDQVVLSKFDDYHQSAFNSTVQQDFYRNIEQVISDLTKKSKLTKIDKKVLYGLVTHNPENLLLKKETGKKNIVQLSSEEINDGIKEKSSNNF